MREGIGRFLIRAISEIRGGRFERFTTKPRVPTPLPPLSPVPIWPTGANGGNSAAAFARHYLVGAHPRSSSPSAVAPGLARLGPVLRLLRLLAAIPSVDRENAL